MPAQANPTTGAPTTPSATADADRLARLEAQFEALRHLTSLADQAGDVPSFARGLVNYLCQTFDASAAALALVNPRTQELDYHTGRRMAGEPLRVPRDRGIAGWVCTHQQTLNVPDVRADDRFDAAIDDEFGFNTRSLLCVPLRLVERIDGVLEVANRTDGQPFSDDDARLLEMIAEQVELLLANVASIQDLQRRNRELETLVDIDRTVNAVHDLDALIATILNSAAEVGHAAGSSLFLRDEATGTLRPFQAVGPAKTQLLDITIEPGQGIVGHCVATGESVYVPDAYSDTRFHSAVDDTTGFRTTSLLAVPLVSPNGVIGALELVNLSPMDNADNLIRLMEAFASQAALALERAQLNRRLELRVELANAELRSTNRTLAVESAKLTAMIEQMAEPVFMIDADGRLMLINRAAEAAFELDSDLEGRPLSEVRNPRLAALLAVDDTEPGGTEIALDGPQRRTYRVQAKSVVDAEEVLGRVIICTDVTELVELARLRSELVSIVSHELCQPLTSIKSFAYSLQRQAEIEADDPRRLLQLLDLQADRLQRLVADLLCLSRIDSGRALELRRQNVELCECVQRVVETHQLANDTHRLQVSLPEPPVRVEADSDKIEQILTNLLSNATKYSPRGSMVEVRLAVDDGHVVMAVIDQGNGIPAEDIDNLFQQYGRLRDANERRITGVGLGLYITKHLVEAHGGTIAVHSVVGSGSTFTVRMPQRQPWTEDC